MFYDISEKIQNIAGGEMKQGEETLTYGNVSILSLLHDSQETARLPVAEKLTRFNIAQRIQSALVSHTKVELSAEECKTILAAASSIATIQCLGKMAEFFASCGMAER